MIDVYLFAGSHATDYQDHLAVKDVHFSKCGRWLKTTSKRGNVVLIPTSAVLAIESVKDLVK